MLQNTQPRLPPFSGSSLICVKHPLILRYRCCYPHSLKKHSRLISYSVGLREWRISFIFLFRPSCQYVTWCHNTEPWGTFSSASGKSKRRITNNLSQTDTEQSNKGGILHFPLCVREILELEHCSVVRVSMFSCVGFKPMVLHWCQKPCWSSQGLSSFLISSQPLPLGWATSVQRLSFNARHADANRLCFASLMAPPADHGPSISDFIRSGWLYAIYTTLFQNVSKKKFTVFLAGKYVLLILILGSYFIANAE